MNRKTGIFTVAPHAFFAVLFCGSILSLLYLTQFPTFHDNLPLALADAQAFIARHAVKETCERPDYWLVASAASEGLLWRSVSIMVLFLTIRSIVALWIPLAGENVGVQGTIWTVNGMEALLGLCTLIACGFEPDTPEQCNGDVCWSSALFYIGITTCLLKFNVIITIWYCGGP